MPISKWVHKLIDRVNGQDGEDGADMLVDYWPLMLRVGRLIHASSDGLFMANLTNLVDQHETAVHDTQSHAQRLKHLKYPSLMGKNWKAQLHTWMQEVLDAFLGFHVEVPEPPDFNRAQRRLMNKFKLGLFFVPQISENQYPTYLVKLSWTRYLQGVDIQYIPLPGRWIAFEMIRKPNYQDGKYPDDQLMAAIGLDSRFNHPHSEKGEGDDLVEDTLPKAAMVFEPLGGTTQVQSAEVFNFLGNLFNWTTQHTADSFSDLGSTNALEWCVNRFGSRLALIVGHSDSGGLACVDSVWRVGRDVNIAFRFLVQF